MAASTAKNLMFLETQLGQYMHEHYEDAGVLYTRPVGFRMPYKRGIDDLERNMKYVEAQLDKYLHSHNADTVESQTNIIATADANFDSVSLTAGSYNMTVTSLAPNTWYYGWANTGTLSVASGYAHVTHTPPELNDFLRLHYRIDLDAALGVGATGSFSADVRGDFANGEFEAFQYDNSLTSLGLMSLPDPGLGASYADWTTLSTTTLNPNSATKTLHLQFTIVVTGGQSADLDNLNFQFSTITDSSTTLYWTPKGFRFPYDWKRADAINNNRRFLETQLSQYLHKHEES